MQSETDLYEWKSEKMMNYHKRQMGSPYRSTVHFENFLTKNVALDNCKIVDIACGTGGATRYIVNQHKNCRILGIDINEDFKDFFLNEKNIEFAVGDIYQIDQKYENQFDGAICLQTLSWLPEYREPLKNICNLNTKWVAMSLLGYEGKINFNIGVENYESLTPEGNFTHSYYNIYSLPLIEAYMKEHGFKKFCFQEFEIDVDLKRPEGKDLGTYTIMTAEQRRLQISGALMMPWYFVYAER